MALNLASFGVSAEILADKTKFDQAVSSIKKDIKELNQDISLADKKWRLLGDKSALDDKLKKLVEKAKDLNNILEAYKDRMKYLEEHGGLAKNGEEMERLGKEIRKTELSILGVEVKIKAAKEALDKFADPTPFENLLDNLDKTSEKLGDVSSLMGEVANLFEPLSTAAQNFLADGVESAKTYEVALANLKRTIDKDSDIFKNFDRVNESIRGMAMEIPATADEIANMVQMMAQLGVDEKGEDALLRFTETMIALGKTTDLSAESAAESIAKLFNIMDSDYSNIDRFASTLLTLGVRSAATESDIAEFSMRIAAAGSSVGMTEQEVLALSTALASVGLKAQAGGSSISTILRNIDKQVDTNGKKLGVWAETAGMTIEQFKAAWKDNAAQAFNEVLVGMAKMGDEGESLNVLLEELGVNNIRQVDSLSRLAGKEDSLSKYIEMANKAWEDNLALTEATNLIYETYDSQLQITNNRWVEFKRQIGEILMPILTKFLKILQNILTWFTQLSPRTKEILTIVLSLVAVIAPLLAGVAGIYGLGQKITKLLGDMLTHFPKLFESINGIWGAVIGISAPMLVVIGLIALILASSEELRNSLWDLVKSVWEEGLKPFLDLLIDTLKTLWGIFKDRVLPIFKELGDLIAQYVVPIVKDLWEWFAKNIIPIYKDVAKVIIDIVIVAIGLLIEIVKEIIEFVKGFFDALKDLWACMQEDAGVKAIIDAMNAVEEAIEGVIGWVRDAVDWFGSLLGKAKEWLGVSDKVSSTGGHVMNAIRGRNYQSVMGSGGYGSGGVTLNNTINVTNTSGSITSRDVMSWGRQIANVVDMELGRRLG